MKKEKRFICLFDKIDNVIALFFIIATICSIIVSVNENIFYGKHFPWSLKITLTLVINTMLILSLLFKKNEKDVIIKFFVFVIYNLIINIYYSIVKNSFRNENIVNIMYVFVFLLFVVALILGIFNVNNKKKEKALLIKIVVFLLILAMSALVITSIVFIIQDKEGYIQVFLSDFIDYEIGFDRFIDIIACTLIECIEVLMYFGMFSLYLSKIM